MRTVEMCCVTYVYFFNFNVNIHYLKLKCRHSKKKYYLAGQIMGAVLDTGKGTENP
jgi:hypothetical protein